jgi:hypothetical protein
VTKNPYPSRREQMTAAATLAAVGPARGLTAKAQAVQAPVREASQETVKGVVFETRTGAGQRQADDRGLAGVLVSNGREVVRTEPDGRSRMEWRFSSSSPRATPSQSMRRRGCRVFRSSISRTARPLVSICSIRVCRRPDHCRRGEDGLLLGPAAGRTRGNGPRLRRTFRAALGARNLVLSGGFAVRH